MLFPKQPKTFVLCVPVRKDHTLSVRILIIKIVGEKGEGQSGKPLSYKGSIFHRIIKVKYFFLKKIIIIEKPNL